VGRGRGGGGGAVGAGRSTSIFDDDLLPQRVGQSSCYQARIDIGRTARRKWHNKRDVPSWIPDQRQRRVLRARRQRQRSRCAAEQRDELAPLHSITSSAMASSLSGIWRPSALAVLRLITSSNLVGCSTGNSAGFAPLRILPA